jgi:hypothetical protein
MAPCATSSRLVAGWLQHSCRRLEIQDDPFRHICFRRKLIRPGSDDLRLQPLLASSSMQVERTPPSNSSIDVFTGVCSRDSEHQGFVVLLVSQPVPRFRSTLESLVMLFLSYRDERSDCTSPETASHLPISYPEHKQA